MIEIKDYLPKIKRNIYLRHIVGKWEISYNCDGARGFLLPEQYLRRRFKERYSEQERVWLESDSQNNKKTRRN